MTEQRNDRPEPPKPGRGTGETARLWDRRSTASERLRVDRNTLIRVAIALVIGTALFTPIVLLSPDPPADVVTWWGLVPIVVLLAVLFETMDAAAGMGFGTSLAPLLLVMGYSPRTVVPALLISQATAGLLAGWFHHELENVQFSFRDMNRATRVALILVGCGILGIIGSVLVTYSAFDTPDRWIETWVAVLVILMGAVGIVHGRLRTAREFRRAPLLLFATVAGINKGIGGGGYGPVVTLGQIFSGIYPKSSAGITSVAEGVVSVFGAATFVFVAVRGQAISLELLPSVFLGGYLGALVAPYLVHVLPNRVWSWLIPAYAFGLGLFLLLRLWVFA